MISALSHWGAPEWLTLPKDLSKRFNVPVIDGVASAVKLSEIIVR
jgi:Asp/Glu/hydantoin racemase